MSDYCVYNKDLWGMQRDGWARRAASLIKAESLRGAQRRLRGREGVAQRIGVAVAVGLVRDDGAPLPGLVPGEDERHLLFHRALGVGIDPVARGGRVAGELRRGAAGVDNGRLLLAVAEALIP